MYPLYFWATLLTTAFPSHVPRYFPLIRKLVHISGGSGKNPWYSLSQNTVSWLCTLWSPWSFLECLTGSAGSAVWEEICLACQLWTPITGPGIHAQLSLTYKMGPRDLTSEGVSRMPHGPDTVGSSPLSWYKPSFVVETEIESWRMGVSSRRNETNLSYIAK